VANPQAEFWRAPGAEDKRRVPVGTPRKSWQVTELWEVHREISRRIVLGQKNTIIAEALNCTPEMVSTVRNSPTVKTHTEIMSAAADADTVDVAKRILEMAPAALDVLEDILADQYKASQALKFKVAESILDRSGHSKIQKTQNLHAHLTGEQLQAIKARAIEKAREAGITVNLPLAASAAL